MKKLPIGVENYAQVIDSYYVDKTLFIKDILDYFVGKSILVTRPRRFGKSLMLSMVDCFFNVNKKSKDLFIDKKIYAEDKKYISYMNSCPVIRINMKNISYSSKENLFNDVKDLISHIYSEFVELRTSEKLLKIEIEQFNKVLNKEFDNIENYTNSILDLSKMLYKHYRKKVVILLDEYDTPIEYAFQKGFYDDIIMFFKKFYSSFLKSNEYSFFSIVTGVLEIAKESIFSDYFDR